MKTSEIKKLFDNLSTIPDFCETYSNKKARALERSDGVQTSGDLHIIFDLADNTKISESAVKGILNFFISNLSSFSDVKFLSTIILLSGFDFISEESEHNLVTLSDDVDETNYMKEIRRMLE